MEEFTRGAQTIRARVAAIHIAVYHGNTGVVRLLCVNGQTELVKLLTDSRDDVVNASCNENGATSLHTAAELGHMEVVKLLLDHNADVNASDTDGVTPLYISAQNGHTELVKLLLDHKADVNASFTVFQVREGGHGKHAVRHLVV